MAGMVWLKTENDSEHGFSKTMYSLVENWTTRWRAWDITRYGSLLKSKRAAKRPPQLGSKMLVIGGLSSEIWLKIKTIG
jgi:hypothetical protein